MKKFFAILFFVSTCAAISSAQVVPVVPFEVVLNQDQVYTDPFIISDGEIFLDLPAISIKIVAGAEDITLQTLHVYTSLLADNLPELNGMRLYDGSTLLAEAYGEEVFFFTNLGISVSANSEKELELNFKTITGSGGIVAHVDLAVAKSGGNDYQWIGSLWGNWLSFVNPDLTQVEYGRNPVPVGEKMYLYPGQYWYINQYYFTPTLNLLPDIITAVDISTELAAYYNLGFWFIAPSVYDQNAGQTYSYVDDYYANFKWYSNSTSGVSSLNGYNYQGSNGLEVGASAGIYSWAEIVIYSQYTGFKTQQFSRMLEIVSIDGIRGDINGDGRVTEEDFWLHVQNPYPEMNFDNSIINFARSTILFDMPTFIDGLLINLWLNNPNDPAIKDLGIGQLMSERNGGPVGVGAVSKIDGQNLSIETDGYAVNVSTILPDGTIWHQAALVENGQVNLVVPDASLEYRIEAVTLPNNVTAIEDLYSVPTEFSLEQNYPNPFNPVTAIRYSLPEAGPVSLVIYDMLGREVATLVDEIKSAGSYQAEFNASGLSSGTYMYRLNANGKTEIKKMTLLK